jgi:hypothetical protein
MLFEVFYRLSRKQKAKDLHAILKTPLAEEFSEVKSTTFQAVSGTSAINVFDEVTTSFLPTDQSEHADLPDVPQ